MTKTDDQTYLKKLRKVQIEILDYISDFCEQNNLRIMLYGGTLLGAIRHKGYIPWDDDIDLAMPRADFEKFIKLWDDTDKFILDYHTTNRNYWLPFLKIRNKNTKFAESCVKENYAGPTGIWVDIMPFDNASDNIDHLAKIKYLKQFYCELIIRKSDIAIDYGNDIKNRIKDIIAKFIPRKTLIKKLYETCTSNHDENSPNLISYHNHRDVSCCTWPRDAIFPLKKAEFNGKKYYVPHNSKVVLTNMYGPDYMKLPPIDQRKTHHPKYVEFEDGSRIDFNE